MVVCAFQNFSFHKDFSISYKTEADNVMNDTKMSRKPILLILILALALTALVSKNASSQSLKNKQDSLSQPEKKVHNIDTGLNYTTIQGAINANETSDRQTIFVEKGTYYEHVIVNKTISLVGEDKSTTVIDGNETTTGFCLNITANNVKVSGFTVQKSHYGIVLNSNHTLVKENIVLNNDWGIYAKSDNNSIVRNVVEQCLDGVHLRGSCTTVAQNFLSHNSFAIYTYICRNNTIVGNEISTSPWGIELVHSEYSVVICNTVSYSSRYGISLVYSNNNTIYHNNIINNADQFFILQSYNNTWNGGVEGNYWSDYTGVDLFTVSYQNFTGSDGIGDASYIIDDFNQDNHPLMGMFCSFNTSYGYQVGIVSNSFVSDFAFSLIDLKHAALSFNITGETGTEGFCRICIPKALINTSYVVKFNGEIIGDPQVRELPCSNETCEYLYVNYTHSENAIEISGITPIPEFSSFMTLSAFTFVTLLKVVIKKREHSM